MPAPSRLCWAGVCFFLLTALGRGQEGLLTQRRSEPTFWGRFRVDYDYRSNGDAADMDLYGYWRGGARGLANGCVDVYTSGRLHSDLDDPSSGDGLFSSLDDADGVTETRLLQATVEIHDRKGLRRLRLGRQYVDAADFLHLDGGQVILFEDGKFGGRAYFGWPVSFFSSVSGDLAGGMSLAGRPWTGSRLRLTYAQYYDASERKSDSHYFADLWQNLSDAVRMCAKVSVLNGDFRMASMSASYLSPGGGTDLHVGGSRWGEFDARTRMYSPIYSALGTQQPHTYLYARAAYELHPAWLVSPGVSLKFADEADPQFSNRDFRDYDLTLAYEPVRSVLSSSLSLHYWDLESGDDFLGLSGEVRYRRRRIWEVRAGSAYARYNYHTYSDISHSLDDGRAVLSEDGTVTEETPYSLSYFLRSKWNVTRWLTLRLEGEIEDDKAVPDLGFRGRASAEVRF